MIKIENTIIDGWKAAIRGMRNPMNSWDKSDSEIFADFTGQRIIHLGDNDLNLMKNLVKAGSDHSKFMRMINVTVDVTAPMYWWKEMDTYKVGTVRNSCSTMHKITAKEFELDDFSHEHLCDYSHNGELCRDWRGSLEATIDDLNEARNLYIKSNDKIYWWQMIQLLPSSYNQRATLQLNYAVLRNIYHSRKNHKLDEWHDFCHWIESLLYAELIIL